MSQRTGRPVQLAPALRVVGLVAGGAGLTLIVPLVYALAIGERVLPFAVPLAVAIMVLGTAILSGRRVAAPNQREALLAAALTWVGLAGLGVLPYVLGSAAGGAGGVIDALFESTSGFSATGATVLTAFDDQPRSLLLWRAQTQWIGGIGLIVLAVIFLPRLAAGGRALVEMETAGPQLVKLAPHLRASTIRIVGVYLALTGLLIGALWLLGATGRSPGMGLFEAVAHAFTTVSLGGFSPEARSIEPFGAWAQWVIAAAIVISGTNFALWYRAIARRRISSLRDDELRWYLGILSVASLLVVIELVRSDTYGIADAARNGVFQTVSIMTGTGYASADFAEWGQLALATLFVLMFVGASTGSPTGALKVMRVVVVGRAIVREIRGAIHPEQVRLVRFGGRPLDSRFLQATLVFALLYLLLVPLSAVALLLLEGSPAVPFGFEDALSASAATLGNVGPGFGFLGPMGSYAPFSDASKVLLSVLMIVGRLEIFPLLVILSRGFWRN